MSGRGTTSPLKDSAPASQDADAYRYKPYRYKQGDTVSYEFSEKGVLGGATCLGRLFFQYPHRDVKSGLFYVW